MEKIAEDLINNRNKTDKPFYWIYPFTNENINGYYKQINLQNKDILSVTSSGDHLLNAIVYGAKNIDAFDINPLARYFVELKIAAIKSLTREEFIDFFYSNSKLYTPKSFLNKKTYDKVKKELYGMVRVFWDYILSKYNPSTINRSRLFTVDFLDTDGLMEANIYMQDCYYNYLKRIVKSKRINYHNIDIKDIEELNKRFDIIILSNILGRLNELYTKDIINLNNLKTKLDNIRTDSSIVILNYNYSNMRHDKVIPEIHDREKVNEAFPNAKKIYFPSSEKYMYPKLFRNIINFEDNVLIDEKKLVKKD